MVRVKGSTLIHRMKYLEAKGTPEQKSKVISLLSPEFQTAIHRGLMPAAWYPFTYMSDLMVKIDEVLGKGDLALMPAIGKFVGEQAVTGIYKMFIKFGSPEFVVKKAAAFWSQLFDSGQITTSIDNPTTGRMILSNFENPSKAFCLSLQGWSEGVLSLSGAKHVKAQVTHWPDASSSQLEITAHWE